MGNFYPRSPCGERRSADYNCHNVRPISIHALLAESDQNRPRPSAGIDNFYPRSPCGERPICKRQVITVIQFLSTLSLRRATPLQFKPPVQTHNFYPRSPCGERPVNIQRPTAKNDFYPRSPCGERREPTALRTPHHKFLSTLSLRRATHYDNYNLHCTEISIHALLAESDHMCLQPVTRPAQFLSTLSLRRATSSFRFLWC